MGRALGRAYNFNYQIEKKKRFAVTLNGISYQALAKKFQFRTLCGVNMTLLIRACWLLCTQSVAEKML